MRETPTATRSTAANLADTPVWPGIRHAFWNITDPGGMGLEKYRRLIIERVLEHGTTAEKRWIRDTYTDAELAEVVMGSRQISARTAALWRNELGIEGQSRAEQMRDIWGEHYFGRV